MMLGWQKLESTALSSLWGVCKVGVDIDKELEMENDKPGAPEEPEVRPDKQEGTNEGDANGKGERRRSP